MIKKYKWFYIAAVLITLAAVAVTAAFFLSADASVTDTVELNRVRTELEMGEIPRKDKYDFIAVDLGGKVIYATKATGEMTLSQRINDAVREGDAVVDFSGGKIIFETGARYRIERAMVSSAVTIAALILLLFLIFAAESVYLDVKVLRPFRKLDSFTREIARGNFDIPLKMDRGNNFGAYTEAFDLMRQNMNEAKRETEEALENKRHLLAELGHDIRTPLSSIIAVAELNEAKGVSGMEVIVEKARQIDNLLTDIYNVSLKDIDRLSVDTVICSAHDVKKLIDAADAAHAVRYANDIPEISVYADKTRLSECIDNVLVNARKYAEGEIDVVFGIDADNLTIAFRDHGDGVSEEELAFIAEKFYRGKIARNKSGVGLGLYITRTLLEKMGGTMSAKNDGGLKITFRLKIVT